MSRTRTVFFIILALYVAVLAIALASNLAGAQFLRGLFIASTVFAAGVVALDMFGIFGEHHGDTAGDVTAGHIGDHFGHAAEGGAPAGHAHAEGVAPSVGEDAAGHAADHSHEGAGSAHHEQAAAGPILSALMYLRLFVYFCLGVRPGRLAGGDERPRGVGQPADGDRGGGAGRLPGPGLLPLSAS